ncbi:MAG: hypothetical protein LBS30_06295 [Planctomycetota bacterium]|jgi:hypothetical protein|nr:hypothetical protein [Planctomycetota bacterium]
MPISMFNPCIGIFSAADAPATDRASVVNAFRDASDASRSSVAPGEDGNGTDKNTI